MALFTSDDLSEFFAADTLGTAATYKEGGVGDGSSIQVIFKEDYVEISGASVDIEGTHPVAVCRAEDVPNAAHDDTVTVDGTVYTVAGIQRSPVVGTVRLVLTT